MTSEQDKKPKDSTTSKETQEQADTTVTSQESNDDEKDPHRGTAETPPQTREMLPGGADPEDYFDDDGALDEELEDLDDEEEAPADEA